MTTLADHLRALPDDGLGALLRLRPDLVVPVPADLAALAARAESRVSVARAMDRLDRFTLELLDALRLARVDGRAGVDAALALAAAGQPAPRPAAARAAIDRLRALFLVYGPEHALSFAAGIDEVCSPYPAGLGRPAAELDAGAADLCADPAGLRRALLAAPPASRAVLERLAGGPPLGSVPAPVLDDPDTPVGWLVAHHLLVPVPDAAAGGSAVELPREIGLLLRRDTGPLGPLHPAPPAPAAPADPAAARRRADTAGAGQTMELIRRTEALLEALAVEPVPVRKAGGLGSRDLRKLARRSGGAGPAPDLPQAAAMIEAAWAAGLVGETEPGATGEARFLPTPGYDLWRASPLARRWLTLARAWLTMPRQPSLAGQRDERDKPWPVLGPELDRTGAPALRAAVLRVLADAPPGVVADAEHLRQVLAWQAPRRYGQGQSAAIAAVLAEASWFGMTGLGMITKYGRALLDEVATLPPGGADPLGVSGEADPGQAAEAGLAALLPPAVDHVLVQADLTAVLPGPATPDLAEELSAVAVAESANVYRITQESLRGALDSGYDAADLHGLFARRSRTPVPQALTYLIDDVARRYGGLRAGSCGGYLRSEDEPSLREILADRRLAGMRLRRLAPTVLVSPYPAGRLVEALREAGYAPVPEDAAGARILRPARARRTPGRRPAPVVDGQPELPAPRIAGIVEQLRRADAAARTARRAPAGLRATDGVAAQEHTEALAVLARAVREKRLVWVGYVDAHGGTAARLVRPVSIGGGYLRAEDERTETRHTFALHRITAAVAAD